MVKGNIEVITKYFYPVAGGIEVNTHRVYSALVKSGWKVTVHTSRDTLSLKNVLPINETVNGIVVKRYNYLSDLVGYTPNIDWQKTNVVALHNFNISHFKILLKILWLKLSNQKKFLFMLTPHGGFTPEWSMFTLAQRISKYIYHSLVGGPIINYCVDYVRAVSEWEKEEMIKNGIKSSKIKTIVNGLEDDAYKNIDKLASNKIRNQVKKFGNYIIQIGRIHPIKNYETVIKALPEIDKKINFVIVGELADKDYLTSLKQLAERLGVTTRIYFAGVVRGVNKYYLIKKSKAMVHMAIWESFCNVINEALSQGTICIAANNTALKYLVKANYGFLVETKNYKGLAEKINWVTKNQTSPKLVKMSNEGMRVAKLMSWNKVAESIEKLLLNIKYEK